VVDATAKLNQPVVNYIQKMSRTARAPRAGGPARKARIPATGRDGLADLILMSRPTHANKRLAHEIEREERPESD
jgi:hypothetical protein